MSPSSYSLKKSFEASNSKITCQFPSIEWQGHQKLWRMSCKSKISFSLASDAFLKGMSSTQNPQGVIPSCLETRAWIPRYVNTTPLTEITVHFLSPAGSKNLTRVMLTLHLWHFTKITCQFQSTEWQIHQKISYSPYKISIPTESVFLFRNKHPDFKLHQNHLSIPFNRTIGPPKKKSRRYLINLPGKSDFFYPKSLVISHQWNDRANKILLLHPWQWNFLLSG
jgi:hypothetical protein